MNERTGATAQSVGPCPCAALLARLERCVEANKARAASEPLAFSIDELLNGPQRRLSAAELEAETQRLLQVCAERGVNAVLLDICTCRDLLESLAGACFQAGLTSAGQYLTYLSQRA